MIAPAPTAPPEAVAGPPDALRKTSAPAAAAFFLPAAALVLVAWLIHLATERSPVFPVDDAYITIHNAQVLHWGHDPNFVGTPALAGATSPFHLALVAALMFALRPVWALDTAAWLGALALALGIARLARAHGAGPGPAFLLVVAGLCAARTPHQLMNGLETGWAMAGVTWAMSYASEEGPAAPVLLAGVCGTLPFLRPELTLLSALLLPLPVIRVWRQGAKPAVIARLALRCALVAAVAAAPWCLWQLLSTGSVVPATIAAKRCYFAESQVPAAIKWLRVEGSLLDLLRACGPLCVAALLLPFTPAGRSALLFTALMLAAYYLEFPGALTHAQGRYLYILTPFLLYAVASAFRLLKRRPVPKRWMALFTLVAAVQTLLLAPFTWREHEAENYATRRDLVATARWCRQNLPPGSRLLIHDAGYISYGTSFEMQDLVGLKTPANIALHRALTYPSGGANRPAAIDAAARRAHADYLVVLDIWDGIFRITDSLRQHGWKLDQVSPDGAYRVYRLSAPQQPVSPPAATSSDIGHTATSETFAEGAGRPPHTSETPPIGGP